MRIWEREKRPNVIHFEAYWSHFNTHTKIHIHNTLAYKTFSQLPAREDRKGVGEYGWVGDGEVDATTTMMTRRRRRWNTGWRFTLSRARRNSRRHGQRICPATVVWLWFRNHYACDGGKGGQRTTIGGVTEHAPRWRRTPRDRLFGRGITQL